MATIEPKRVLDAAPGLIDETTDALELVFLWRAIGMAGRVTGDAARSMQAFESAVATASANGLTREAVENAISLAMATASNGRYEEAMALLDSLDPGPDHVGTVVFQRGTVLAMSGRLSDAAPILEESVPLLEAAGNRPILARAYKNLGLIAFMRGDPTTAIERSKQAIDAFNELDDALEVAATGHNLGLALAAGGDLVEALEWFNRSLPELEAIVGPNFEPGRCQTLLAAGLFEEAHEEALRLAQRLHQLGMVGEEPEALLLAAEASLLLGQAAQAGEEAARAATVFNGQARDIWAARARLLEWEAIGGPEDPSLFDRLIDLLDVSGMAAAAVRARAAAATSAARQGEVARARKLLEDADPMTGQPSLATEIQLRLASVEIKRAIGDRRGAAATAAAGMRLLDRHQRSVGAIDVRAGLGRHAARLAVHGLALAIDSRRPRSVWRWMERSRATALAIRPVRPPRSDEVAALLPELRSLSAAAERPDSDATTRRQLARLESRIADLTRASAGVTTDTSDGFDPQRILEGLDGRCLIELARVASTLWAVVAFRRTVRMVEIGPALAWNTESRVLSSAVRQALTRTDYPVDRLARRLAPWRELIRRLLPADAAALVAVPAHDLGPIPWTLVSPIPVTVEPSSVTWLRATERPGDAIRVAAMAGPGLRYARPEVEAVAAAHHTTALPGVASAPDMLSTLPTVDVIHLACHGRFRQDQPMFTSIKLADGDVHLHEIEQVSPLPSLVVLSSCETGSVSGSESEMLGMASVLMNAGVRTVVASPWPIPDSEDTVASMTSFHQALAAGREPAECLHARADSLPTGAYLTFGA